MTRVVLSLGSNLPGPEGDAQVNAAIEWLRSFLTDVVTSGLYTTPPYNSTGADYTNCVVAGYTDLPAAGIDRMAKDYETANGRTPEARLDGRVTIDIDLVIYGALNIRPRELSRPYFLRGYTLLPRP